MRLIDADDLKDWSEIVPLTEDGGIDINDFEEKLKSMPTVDAVPVRHGRWIKGSETKMIKKNRYLILADAMYCSECENEAYWDTDYGQQLFDYCPNCGARMDEE